MAFEIVSREAELASVHAFIGRSASGPAALVLEREAGIGKSTLWLAGVEHARALGLRVLSSQPAEAERRSPRAGIATRSALSASMCEGVGLRKSTGRLVWRSHAL